MSKTLEILDLCGKASLIELLCSSRKLSGSIITNGFWDFLDKWERYFETTEIIFCWSIHNKCGVPRTKKDHSSHLKAQWCLYQLDQILELIWGGNRQIWLTICDKFSYLKEMFEQWVCSLVDRLHFNTEVYSHVKEMLMSRYGKLSNHGLASCLCW